MLWCVRAGSQDPSLHVPAAQLQPALGSSASTYFPVLSPVEQLPPSCVDVPLMLWPPRRRSTQRKFWVSNDVDRLPAR